MKTEKYNLIILRLVDRVDKRTKLILEKEKLLNSPTDGRKKSEEKLQAELNDIEYQIIQLDSEISTLIWVLEE